MKAVVCADRDTVVDDVADPSPGADQVVVAVEACGLCGSDVHAVEQNFFPEGHILGHEFAGRIVEVGPAVTDWKVDQNVAVNPLGSCTTCRACRRGLPFLCENRGNCGITMPGAFAQYVAVGTGQLVALPEGVPVELGAHAEPLAVAMKAVELARVGPGDSVLVYGVGSIGLNAIVAARLAGVQTVVGAGRSPGRREAATRMGASTVIDTREVGVTDWARDNAATFSAVLDCSGAPEAMTDALALLEPGGVAVAVSLGDNVLAVPLLKMVSGGQTVVGSCAFDGATYDRAVDHIVSGRAPMGDIISERVGLADTPDALTRLRSPGSLVRVLTRPWD